MDLTDFGYELADSLLHALFEFNEDSAEFVPKFDSLDVQAMNVIIHETIRDEVESYDDSPEA